MQEKKAGPFDLALVINKSYRKGKSVMRYATVQLEGKRRLTEGKIVRLDSTVRKS